MIRDQPLLRGAARIALWPLTLTAKQLLTVRSGWMIALVLFCSIAFWIALFWIGARLVLSSMGYMTRRFRCASLSTLLMFFVATGLLCIGPRSAVASHGIDAREQRLRKGGAFDIDSYYDEYESVQRFAFELKFSSYRPRVDDEFSGSAQPFEDFFQDGKGLMTEVELDYQFLHAIGSLGVGFGMGYFRTSADTCATSTGGQCDEATRQEGNSSRFSVLPVRALLVYRFDYAFRELSIPLVPFMKLGFNYNFWKVRTAGGDVAVAKNQGRGEGGTAGWQLNLGVSMPLGFLEPDAARTLDSDYGVNHTHLFFEWSKIVADGFGSKKRLNVGGNAFTGGLLLEF